jgi:magnesium transporter
VFIREGRARLNHLRGHLAPQLSVFERVADEIPDVKGLSGDPHRYFVNIRAQLGHAVNSVDACNDALSGMLNMGLNRMTFLFTVVATLFLPITFLSGFFGQNFQWFLDRVTSATSFWLLGIGSMLLSLLASLWVIYRQLGPREAPKSLAQLLGCGHHSAYVDHRRLHLGRLPI